MYHVRHKQSSPELAAPSASSGGGGAAVEISQRFCTKQFPSRQHSTEDAQETALKPGDWCLYNDPTSKSYKRLAKVRTIDHQCRETLYTIYIRERKISKETTRCHLTPVSLVHGLIAETLYQEYMMDETSNQISWFQTERDNVTQRHRQAMQEKAKVQQQKKMINGDIFKSRLYQQQIDFWTLVVDTYEDTDHSLCQEIEHLKQDWNSYSNMNEDTRKEIVSLYNRRRLHAHAPTYTEGPAVSSARSARRDEARYI